MDVRDMITKREMRGRRVCGSEVSLGNTKDGPTRLFPLSLVPQFDRRTPLNNIDD